MRTSLPTLVAGVFLLLHLAPPLGIAPCAWGVDSLAYLPVAGRWAFVTLGLALFVPAVRRAAVAAGGRWPAHRILEAGLLAAAAVALFLALRSAAPILGDGLLHLGDLQRIAARTTPFRDIAWANNNAPLASAVVYALHRLLGGGTGMPSARGIDPITTFRILSVVSGVLYVGLATATARFFGRRGVGRGTILAFLLSAGYLQLFAGYVELYTPLMPLILGFALAAGRAIESRRAPWLAAAVLGVAIPFHVAAATFLPALGYAGWAATTGRAARRAAITALALAATAAITGLVFAAVGFDPIGYLRSPKGARLLPVLAEPGFAHNYRMFDPRHFLDLANQYLLVAPAAIMGIALVRRTKGVDGVDRFLLVAAAIPVLFTAVVNPEVGPFRDWDALSFAALPLTLYVSVRLGRAGGGDLAHTVVVIAGAAALHTVAWLAVNADARATETRFARLLESCPVSKHAHAYGWETMGSQYLRERRADDAAAALDRAVAAAPDNPRLWNMAGKLHLAAGRTERAERCFAEAVSRDSTFAESWLGLGTIRLLEGDPADAARCFSRAVTNRPDFAEAWLNLGFACEELGDTDRALESFRAAARYGPRLAPAWFHLARIHFARGEETAGRSAASRFLELEPRGPGAEEVRGWLAQ